MARFDIYRNTAGGEDAVTRTDQLCGICHLYREAKGKGDAGLAERHKDDLQKLILEHSIPRTPYILDLDTTRLGTGNPYALFAPLHLEDTLPVRHKTVNPVVKIDDGSQIRNCVLDPTTMLFIEREYAPWAFAQPVRKLTDKERKAVVQAVFEFMNFEG